jgi:hypothetical protein
MNEVEKAQLEGRLQVARAAEKAIAHAKESLEIAEKLTPKKVAERIVGDAMLGALAIAMGTPGETLLAQAAERNAASFIDGIKETLKANLAAKEKAYAEC